MNQPSRTTRRQLLRMALVLGALSWLPSLGRRVRAAVAASGPAAARLGGVLRQRASAGRIGLEYLKTTPEEGSTERLVDLICKDAGHAPAALAKLDDIALRALLSRQQQRDFERARVVRVQGWVLSATEARLCALAALA